MITKRFKNLRFALPTACVLALFQAAVGCGSDGSPKGTTQEEPPGDAQPSTAELREGIYDGAVTALDGQERDASLGVWTDAQDFRGTLVAGSETPFSVNFHETGAEITAVGAFCNDCVETQWEVDVERVGSGVRLSVREADREALGFSGGVFVPHDGFKPEFLPEEDVEFWRGRVFAVDASRVDDGVLDSTCELSVAVDEPREVRLVCDRVESDSHWVNVEPDSWVEDSDGASFSTTSSRIFEGKFENGPQGRVFEGRIWAPSEGAEPDSVIGLFRFDELLSGSGG